MEKKGLYRYDLKEFLSVPSSDIFADSSSTAVSAETYELLAGQYDSLRKDYNLFRTLLIAVIVIALVLVVLLIVSLTGKKDRGRRERISERKDETESRPQKEEAPLQQPERRKRRS